MRRAHVHARAGTDTLSWPHKGGLAWPCGDDDGAAQLYLVGSFSGELAVGAQWRTLSMASAWADDSAADTHVGRIGYVGALSTTNGTGNWTRQYAGEPQEVRGAGSVALAACTLGQLSRAACSSNACPGRRGGGACAHASPEPACDAQVIIVNRQYQATTFRTVLWGGEPLAPPGLACPACAPAAAGGGRPRSAR